MPEDGNNFKIEFGVIKGTLEQVAQNQERMNEKLDTVCSAIPAHNQRLDALETAKRNWTRFFFVVFAGILIAGVSALLSMAK